MAGFLKTFNLCLVLPYGAFLAAFFSGNLAEKRKIIDFSIFGVVLLALQGIICKMLGISVTEKIYPFIAHLPVFLFLHFRLKRSFGTSIAGILVAYLCCQLPLWLSLCAYLPSSSELVREITYLTSIVLCFYILARFCAPSVRAAVAHSRRSLLLFCAMPLAYYCFDYVLTVYSNVLYSKSAYFIEFLPAFMALFYVAFVIVYRNEVRKNSEDELERAKLTLQLEHLENQLEAMTEAQMETLTYRHDMRHHLTLIGNLLQNGETCDALKYISSVESDIEDIAPSAWCSNQKINLLLSFFSKKAEKQNIQMQIKAELPSELTIPETALCSLISNALENAITASAKISDPGKRNVILRCGMQANYFLIYVENTVEDTVNIQNNIPISSREGHGFGAKSMTLIAKKLGGNCIFESKTHRFIVKIILPAKNKTQEGK